MPELAEAHVMADALDALIAGWDLTQLEINEASQYYSKPLPGLELLHLPERVTQVQAYGKKVVLSFGSGRQLVCQLGMEGRWLSAPGKKSGLVATFTTTGPGHAALTATLPPGLVQYVGDRYHATQMLYFDDQRVSISKLLVLPSPEALSEYLARFGPDPLHEVLTPEEWRPWFKLDSCRARIGTVINDQEVVHGIGNYLRAEILYRAGISPYRRVCDLTEEEFAGLIEELYAVAREAYAARGHTLRSYVHLDGTKGTFQPQVYGQKTDPWGNPVLRENMGGQTIHWVPAIQA